jgi:hypothetical protein
VAAVVPAFREFLDHLPVEGRDVVGLARSHESLVDDDLLIDPGGACITKSAM